jgi:hypothetical protein
MTTDTPEPSNEVLVASAVVTVGLALIAGFALALIVFACTPVDSPAYWSPVPRLRLQRQRQHLPLRPG